MSLRHESRASDVPLALPALEALADRRLRERGRACPPCLATGGHLKVAPAVWTGKQAFLLPALGSMDEASQRAAFDRAVGEIARAHPFEPARIACDLHPDYYTTRWAAERGVPVIPVQHHHAHAVACMVEHGLLDREVIAVTWDGTGFGPDGTIWGGEILRAGVGGFQRIASLERFALPGGESAIRRPNRIALAMLVQSRGAAEVLRDGRLLDRLGASLREAKVLVSMIERGFNTPRTSSVGRLFDAVAAMVLGIHHVDFEGAAAMQLEAAADPTDGDAYELPMHHDARDDPARADWRPMLDAVVADCVGGTAVTRIAARFHNALARWAARVGADQPERDVVISGGCFLNKRLTERVAEAVRVTGRRVFRHETLPTGDAGLAVGQLAVAMSR